MLRHPTSLKDNVFLVAVLSPDKILIVTMPWKKNSLTTRIMLAYKRLPYLPDYKIIKYQIKSRYFLSRYRI